MTSEEVIPRHVAIIVSTCFARACLGPAQDMRRCGDGLAVILSAGQWRSAAFLLCLDVEDLEAATALAAAIDSDDEEWLD